MVSVLNSYFIYKYNHKKNDELELQKPLSKKQFIFKIIWKLLNANGIKKIKDPDIYKCIPISNLDKNGDYYSSVKIAHMVKI